MAERSESQRIGSTGQRLVELLIEKSQCWISRRQDEDFGIDLEAEVAYPEAFGEIVKIQIKGTEEPEIKSQGVKAVIESKYLRLADSLRVPLIFVVADIRGDRAWYLWLQGWLVDQRQAGRTIESFGDTVTVYIPETESLPAGLQGPLIKVARWSHENQLVLSLTDTLRTAAATHNETVFLAVLELIGTVDRAYRDFPLGLLIDTIAHMSQSPRAMWEMSLLGRFLAMLCKQHGGRITKANLIRMVVPGKGWSRAGMVGLGALYDEHEAHIRSLDLAATFEEAGHPEVSFYCRLREKHHGVKSDQLAFGEYDYTVGDLTVQMEDKGWFLNKWANRGESAYLDYLTLKESETPVAPPEQAPPTDEKGGP